jgi:hypothetical protein
MDAASKLTDIDLRNPTPQANATITLRIEGGIVDGQLPGEKPAIPARIRVVQ